MACCCRRMRPIFCSPKLAIMVNSLCIVFLAQLGPLAPTLVHPPFKNARLDGPPCPDPPTPAFLERSKENPKKKKKKKKTKIREEKRTQT